MPIKNKNLLRMAADDERRRIADQAMRASHRFAPAQLARSVASAGDASPSWLSAPVRAALSQAEFRAPLAKLIATCVDRSDLMGRPGREGPHVVGLAGLACWHDRWLRDPADWRPASHNRDRQFSSLARHLLARYAVPSFMDGAWLDRPTNALPGRTAEQGWFVHIGGGANLRTATALPLPLTKMAAHHTLLAPTGTVPRHALVWGWVRALGASARLATALVAAAPLHRLAEPDGAVDQLPFWESVVRFFVAHDAVLDVSQVGPVVDFLHHQKFVPADPVAVNGVFHRPGPPQPGLSMRGRDLATLVDQTQAWHRRLARAADGQGLRWVPSGVDGFDRIEGAEGNQRRFVLRELLDSVALRAEGTRMHHCVFTYARQCHQGRAAIFSLQLDHGQGLERLATIEVNVRARQIVQARGPYNRTVTGVEARLLRAWAQQARLTFGRFVGGLTG